MRLRKEIRGGSDGFDRILMSASGPGCVKTRLSQGRAELFSNCLLLTEVASAIGFPQRRNRDGNSTRKFNVGVFTQPGTRGPITTSRYGCKRELPQSPASNRTFTEYGSPLSRGRGYRYPQ